MLGHFIGDILNILLISPAFKFPKPALCELLDDLLYDLSLLFLLFLSLYLLNGVHNSKHGHIGFARPCRRTH